MNLKTYLHKNRGSTTKIAEQLEVTPQCVRFWSLTHVPAARVLSVYLATDRQVHPSEMRPDLYPLHMVKFIED